ncbi:hypothetical protein [Bacillus toyonensis]|uniref:hypothetical protein n=1 Tax=Bacillus toyonensis TaxID=155322 RepID=UPI002E200291|nr:hypothetical protein [Bacillus toyonensis]
MNLHKKNKNGSNEVMKKNHCDKSPKVSKNDPFEAHRCYGVPSNLKSTGPYGADNAISNTAAYVLDMHGNPIVSGREYYLYWFNPYGQKSTLVDYTTYQPLFTDFLYCQKIDDDSPGAKFVFVKYFEWETGPITQDETVYLKVPAYGNTDDFDYAAWSPIFQGVGLGNDTQVAESRWKITGQRAEDPNLPPYILIKNIYADAFLGAYNAGDWLKVYGADSGAKIAFVARPI